MIHEHHDKRECMDLIPRQNSRHHLYLLATVSGTWAVTSVHTYVVRIKCIKIFLRCEINKHKPASSERTSARAKSSVLAA